MIKLLQIYDYLQKSQLNSKERERISDAQKYIKWTLAFINVVLIVLIGVLINCKYKKCTIDKNFVKSAKCINVPSVLSKYQFESEVEVQCARSLDKCPHPEFKHGDGFCDDDLNNLGNLIITEFQI